MIHGLFGSDKSVPYTQLFQKSADNSGKEDNMPFPLILIPIVGLFSGCVGPKEEENEGCEENEECEENEGCHHHATPPPPEPGPGEKLYSDENNYVLVDERLGEGTARFYLNVLPIQAQRVLDFFGIDSPWKRNMLLKLVEFNSPNNSCSPFSGSEPGVRVGGCGGSSRITLLHEEEETGLIKENAAEGKIYWENGFTHEMSHALRTHIASLPAFLEEGLATYTQIELVTRQENFNPQGGAQKIYDGSMSAGKTVLLQKGSYITRRITLDSWNPTSVKFFWDRSGLAENIFDIPWNQYAYNPHNNYIFYVEPDANASSVLVKIYMRATESFEKGDVIGFRYGDLMRSDIDCKMGGFDLVEEIMTEDGPATVLKISTEYTKKKSDYTTKFCFWDLIRESHGHLAVQAMVQSMVEFAKEHENMCDPYAYFPFFETFREITGMDKTEAETYFALFSAPMDDGSYPLGRVAWPR